MPDRLTGDNWAKALHSFNRTAWRWETQGVYREPYEQEPLQQFLAGKEPDTTFLEGWLDDVRRTAASGRRYGRVRVLTDPLTDYLRFELALTPLNVAAGEDVRVMPAARRLELGLPDEDFWLFDDEWAALMHFGDDGFEFAEVITDRGAVRRFREFRDLAWRESVPFDDYMK